MMSGTSEPRQMVLKMEKNLGTRPRLDDMDDDTQVSSNWQVLEVWVGSMHRNTKSLKAQQ